jgi:hypothetical protein
VNYKPSERGKVWLQVDNKTEILVDKGCDMEGRIKEYNDKQLTK